MELIFCLDHSKKNLSELHSIDLSQSIGFGFFRYQIIYFHDDFLSYSVALIFRVKSNLVEHFSQIININFREIVIVGWNFMECDTEGLVEFLEDHCTLLSIF